MNFGRELSIPQENVVQIRGRGPWMPATPEKPISQRPNPIPIEREKNPVGGNQLRRENWEELVGIYSGFLQENANNNGVISNPKPIGLNGQNGSSNSRDFHPAEKVILNPNVGSCTLNFGNNNAAWNNTPWAGPMGTKNQVSVAVASGNGMPIKSVHVTSRSTIPISISQVGRNWEGSNSTSQLLANRNCTLDSNGQINGERNLHMPKDGYAIPYRPNYNLNSPPRSEAGAAPSPTRSFPFAPVTPDQAKQFENHGRSHIPSFSVDESSSQEKYKQENLFTSTGSEVIENHCDELLQNIVNSSAAAVSIPLQEKNTLYNGGDLGIDLNTTPQQKPTKRRKHRPKVFVEGKPKRAPKSTTPKNIGSRENPPEKRKYVHKNGHKDSVSQNPDVVNEVAVPNAESVAKSCRRELNFDLALGKSASHWAEMNQEKCEAFNLNLDSQDTGLCNIIDNDSGVKSTTPIRTPNNSSSIENPSGKRKYICKNDLNASVAQNPDAINEVTVPNTESAAKSCRRVLSFDLENGTRDESSDKIAGHRAEIHQENSTGCNLNLDSQAATRLCFVTNNGPGTTKSPMQIRNPNEHIEEHPQAGTTSTFNHSENPMPSRCISLPKRCASAAPTTATIDHTSNDITRGVNMKIPISFLSSGKYGHNQVHQQTHGEVEKIVFQANSSHQNLERTGQAMWPSTSQLVSKNVENSDENRGSKREYFNTLEQTHSCAENLTGSPLLCTQIYRVDGYSSNDSVFGTDCPETHKSKKSDNGYHASIFRRTPCIASIKDCSREGEKGGENGIYTNSSRSQIDRKILDSYFGSERTAKKLNYGVNADNNSQKQVVSSEPNSNAQSMAERRFTGSTPVQDQTSHNEITNWKLLSSTQPKKALATIDSNPNISAMKPSSTDKVCLQEHKEVLHGYQQASMNARDPSENKKCPVQIDYLIYRLKRLEIKGGSNEIVVKEKNALVPHKGAGTIVPYEGFDIKKRKMRPKVDLDLETNRVWNLLMWKEGSECFEAQSKDKEKRWEEERKVFRGRADSFIARMHLVQGDRRFSRWKGSVVDSVIGVFLTQNVSDHLSSSAFMSLASRFPLQSTTAKQTWYQTGESILIEEPVVRTPEVDCNRRITRQPFHNGSSVACHELAEHGKDNLNSTAERTSSLNEHNRIAEKELISSENSFTSVSFQPNGKIRSFFVSNSEAQDPTTGHRPNNFCGPTSTNLLHSQKTIPFQEFHSHGKGTLLIGRSKNRSENTEKQIPRVDKVDNPRVSSMFTLPINASIPNTSRPIYPANDFQLHMTTNSRVPEVNSFGLLGEQRMSSLSPSAYGITKSNGLHHKSKRVIHMEETTNNTTVQQNGVPKVQASTVSLYSLLCNTLRPVPQTAKDQLFINTHQQQRTEAKDPRKPAELLAIMQTGKRQQITNVPKLTGSAIGVKDTISMAEKKKWLENKVAEVNSKEQVSSSVEAPSGISPNLSNTKKRKAEEEKTKLFDWDTLRKQVQPNGMRKQRGKDAMDSMDYEALRCANVNEISDAIKERGMNNLLADRIKDFLNRLLREHGSIDLEWLRDVPSDKAKEFLLSIRGLGIKSVECVRLLTLHHLAFPVDTNVGRIAVRLGWVPLQPLPEELQLHLLELYPMLESIQKYLWPRLCKLDQRTLYELHYQMITFGKVFCTKSKPNCNACPMKAECRHFASAFASARLALPGPEAKTLVSSTIPISTDKNPTVTIKPVSIPPPENSATKECWFVTKPCVPIVEEPTTPEMESTEVTKSEIEDAFYEDPDEIPTIKLSIEEFTVNLHNYMQQHMELQEGDMSKALVVLNQAAASLPAPKLKNTSRLRTEHQVYELPDSHPLLNVMDRREPDDPSPYLLAIWTPGETVNSVQPSERTCGSQETGKFCCENTCFSCNSIREANSLTVRGTLLIPCRTATRGSFPLNGTYFQVNEVFADHESSLKPIDIPRRWLWNLPRRTVYFGTSVSTIFKGLSTEGIQSCFWRGFVCVRGFDQKTRAPRPLIARLHFPASKLAKTKNEDK